jgi:hypothetical protein
MLTSGLRMTERDVLLFRGEIANLMMGTVFSFVGLVAFAIAVIRHRREFMVLLWGGCFMGMYGFRLWSKPV